MKLLILLTACLALITAGLNAQTQPPALPVPPSTPVLASSPNPEPAAKPSPSASASPAAASAAPSNANVDYLKAFADANVASLKIGQQRHSNDTLLGALALLIPIVVLLGFFATVTVIAWLGVAAQDRQRRLTHETIRLMIEKGQPVPPELFLNPKIARPRNDLRRGVVLIAVGAGCVVMFLAHHQHGIWGLGVIPLLMGIGYIIVYKIQGSEKPNNNPSQPQ